VSQLSAQSIRRLCMRSEPMIDPFESERKIINGKSYGLSASSYDVRIAHNLMLNSGQSSLAHTVENFRIPTNVVGYVVDKSTYARRFITAFNTLLDPGWEGNLTLELVNLGDRSINIHAGDPIVQIVFHWLDEHTDRPYDGKYMYQTPAAHGPRYEGLE